MDLIQQTPVSAAILGLTVFVSLFAFGAPELLREFMLHPYSFVRRRRYHTLLTSGFVHADIPHLAFNMLTFYFFATTMRPDYPGLEPLIGHWKFLALYVVALCLSDVTTIIKHRNDPDYACLGASGAVTAVIFSFIIYRPTASIGLMFIPIPIPAPLFGVLYIAVSIYAMKRPGSRINHEAHLWGAVSGLLMTLILVPSAYGEFFRQLKDLIG